MSEIQKDIDVIEGKKNITLNHKELVAVEICLRFLAHNLKRDRTTGMCYLPSGSGIVCSRGQATAIERALTKVMES